MSIINDRIRALTLAYGGTFADATDPNMSNHGEWQRRYFDKFAEQVIAECANFIHIECENTGDAERLMKHFGKTK
jgi:hypothetical protein